MHALVIGSPSLDILHVKGSTYETIGGAGMYMAMAACRSGLRVTLFSPRPQQVPNPLQQMNDRLEDWIGPTIPQQDIPRFEIAYQDEKANYISAHLAAETTLDPATLPQELSIYDGIHITAMGDANMQQKILTVCEERGARWISLGTGIENMTLEPDITRRLMNQADVFFMNQQEALSLFDSLDNAFVPAGHLLFITLGSQGVLVVQGDAVVHVPAQPALVKDPTGAGETFCGAVFAHLLNGCHPIMAARKAVILAAEEIEAVGPEKLMVNSPPPAIALDKRVVINTEQVEKVSRIVKALQDADPFSFISDFLPPRDHPGALDYFCAVILHQFGFWEAKNSRYSQPMIAFIDGRQLKGSAYLFYAFNRYLEKQPDFFIPQNQAQVTRGRLLNVFKADDGTDPMPAIDLHVAQARSYGKDMLALGLTPRVMVEKANQSEAPLGALIAMLDHIGGYKEDPIRKKSNLLALCLSQRPEKFLRFGRHESVLPVVDYHGMRSCLRLGLIDVVDDALRVKIVNRQLLQPDEEWAVRYAVYHTQQQVEKVSGKPIGAVDWFFFNYMRSHCPEMTDPICAQCAADPVCAHRKELFQPVIRTTFY